MNDENVKLPVHWNCQHFQPGNAWDGVISRDRTLGQPRRNSSRHQTCQLGLCKHQRMQPLKARSILRSSYQLAFLKSISGSFNMQIISNYVIYFIYKFINFHIEIQIYSVYLFQDIPGIKRAVFNHKPLQATVLTLAVFLSLGNVPRPHVLI